MLNFSKRVQGLSLATSFKNEESEYTAFASGALVRGQFTTKSICCPRRVIKALISS